ncbi:hypothetical protein [Nioella nitratireducens]|uniref:hypothetical protein n=1 Tax=Nioella nitratireducens TaxID=1287720 RepID=UPI0008FD3FB6|nr:hypothetical protein [Nioella nitratireducens]
MKDNRTTIRNIQPDILAEAREIVRANRHETMGSFVTDALATYIDLLPVQDDDVEEIATVLSRPEPSAVASI